MTEDIDPSPAQSSVDAYHASLATNGEPQCFADSEKLLRGLTFHRPEYGQELVRLATLASSSDQVRRVVEFANYAGNIEWTTKAINIMESRMTITEDAALAAMGHLKETTWNSEHAGALLSRLITQWRNRIISTDGLERYLNFLPPEEREKLSISVS